MTGASVRGAQPWLSPWRLHEGNNLCFGKPNLWGPGAWRRVPAVAVGWGGVALAPVCPLPSPLSLDRTPRRRPAVQASHGVRSARHCACNWFSIVGCPRCRGALWQGPYVAKLPFFVGKHPNTCRLPVHPIARHVPCQWYPAHPTAPFAAPWTTSPPRPWGCCERWWRGHWGPRVCACGGPTPPSVQVRVQPTRRPAR